MEKKNLVVRLPIDIHEYAKKEAEANDRSLNSYLIQLIKSDMKKSKEGK